ncbi:hypothetical protein MTO96_030226, partial [Rhipicephalus appendiculatus]
FASAAIQSGSGEDEIRRAGEERRRGARALLIGCDVTIALSLHSHPPLPASELRVALPKRGKSESGPPGEVTPSFGFDCAVSEHGSPAAQPCLE